MKTPRSNLILPLPILGMAAVSCNDEAARMGREFRLPEGNAENGQVALLDMKCQQFQPGGTVRKVKTHAERVTSIMQPRHFVSPEHLAKLGEDTPTTRKRRPRA